MILNRTAHRIGYLGSMKSWDVSKKEIWTLHAFLDFVIDHLKYNSENGIQMLCFDLLDMNLQEFDFSSIEEDSEEQNKIDLISNLVSAKKIRIFFFLGKGYFLGSQLPEIVQDTKKIILKVSDFLDCIGVQEPSILIRVGSAYGNRKETLVRFSEEVKSLPNYVSRKLAVMNDEKPSLFSVTDLLAGVYYSTKIPICFRFLPHQFNNGGLSSREALFLSASTWPNDIKPVFIHSEPQSVDEFGIPSSPSPSAFLSNRIPTFNLEIDIIVDSLDKDLSCIKYMKEIKSLKPIVINKIPD
jgi:UV DNA damage repair endonuclease